MKTVNFDLAAAAPVAPEVLEKMLPLLIGQYGNPSSTHGLGATPRKAMDEARENTADLIGAKPREIIFTASASESNNMAVKGLAAAGKKKGNHIVSSAVEHFSVLNPLKTLQREGYRVTLLPVDRFGMVDPGELAAALTDETIMVSIQAANPEIGTIQPLKQLAAEAGKRGVPFHTDAAAAAGWLPLDVDELKLDLLTLSGDQFYGPKGAAALYVRSGTKLLPLVEGGTQERGLRAGTENTAAIAGLGEAARLARLEMDKYAPRVAEIRDRLKESLFETVPHLHLNGHPEQRLPRNLNIAVEFVEVEALLMRLEMAGIYVSSGSSCASQALKASHVLTAIGLPPELAQGSLQFTLGKESKIDDIPYVTENFSGVAELLRKMSPLYHKYLKEGHQDARV